MRFLSADKAILIFAFCYTLHTCNVLLQFQKLFYSFKTLQGGSSFPSGVLVLGVGNMYVIHFDPGF